MHEGLNASPKYGEKIAKVRGLSKEGKSPAEIKEQAKLLRMEIMLDNAECARLLTRFIEDYPTATAEDFQYHAFATGLISQPEIVQDFLDQLRYQRDRVGNAKKEIQHHSKQNNISQARVIFSWMGAFNGINKFPKPKGKMELDTSYPLALILYVENAEDFNSIDSRTNVGGFYKSSQGYARPNNLSTKMVSDSFPVVVVKGPNPKNSIHASSTTEHEKGHAENKAIQEALAISKKRAVWAERPYNPDKIWKSVVSMREATVQDIEREKKSKEWQVVMDAALYLAKDELLAEFKATHGHTEWHQSYMKKKDGLYDYFINRFHIKPESALYKALREEYDQILDQAQLVIEQIVNGYSTGNLILRDRIELSKWVLAQIPIQNWSKQIRETFFYQEIEEFKEVDTILAKIYTVESWRNLEDPKVVLAHKFRDQIFKNQNKPLIPLIRKFKQDIANLEKGTK